MNPEYNDKIPERLNRLETRLADIEAMLSGKMPIPEAHILNARLGANSVRVMGNRIEFDDAAADPTAAGQIQRNGAALKFHNGTNVIQIGGQAVILPLHEMDVASPTGYGNSGQPLSFTELTTDMRRVIDFDKFSGAMTLLIDGTAPSGTTGDIQFWNVTDGAQLALVSFSTGEGAGNPTAKSAAITKPAGLKQVTFRFRVGATTQGNVVLRRAYIVIV